MTPLFKFKFLRRFALPALKAVAFDFTLKHPWVKNCRVKLNSFKHKGYWYHGKRRELDTMLLFKQIIQPRETVVEIGGHIGFISLFFADLVGSDGRVVVFEPGANNLPYIRKNISSGLNSVQSKVLSLREVAVGETCGTIKFYEDSLTGQNNSAVENFAGLEQNQKNAYVKTDVTMREVEVISIDDSFKDSAVDFVKIDIEGYEWQAISGARQTIARCLPAIMVEVQASRKEIFVFFHSLGYVLFNDQQVILNDPSQLNGNVFCLHTTAHAGKIKDLSQLNSQLP